MKRLYYILIFLVAVSFVSATYYPYSSYGQDPKDAKVTIYPNPATDYFYVSTDNNVKPKQIIVYNIVGNKVLDQSLKSNTNKEMVSVNRLPSGKYFVKIFLSDNSQTMKHLIVQ